MGNYSHEMRLRDPAALTEFARSIVDAVANERTAELHAVGRIDLVNASTLLAGVLLGTVREFLADDPDGSTVDEALDAIFADMQQPDFALSLWRISEQIDSM